LKKYLNKQFPNADYLCTYEAGFCGFWIQKEMEKAGLKTKIAHAADIPTSDKERKQKEDKRDARKIAKALKDRSLIRERYSIVKSGRRIKSQIKSHLALYNVEIQDEMINKHWSRMFVTWLWDIQGKHKDEALKLQLDRLEAVRKLQLKANMTLRKLAESEEHKELVCILLSVPGIGTITAMLLISELIDMKRFSSFDKLCSYVGYIPTTNASGDKENRGHLTKRCNSRIRSALIESSWVAVRNDQALLMKFETLKKRMTGQEAIVRIARILLSRIRNIWLNEHRYQMGIT